MSIKLENGMLIGISGKIGSGKDTFANLLALAIYNQELSSKPEAQLQLDKVKTYTGIYKANSIEIVKFADALKDTVCRLTGCTREQLEDQDFKNSTMPEEWWYWQGKSTTNVSDSRISYKQSEVGVNQHIYELIKPTYRQFLQELGTNVLRNWIPNIHVNATFSTWRPVPVPVKDAKISGWGKQPGELQVQKEQWPKWIITDMRFPNEAEAVRERGGILLRMERIYSRPMSVKPLQEHISETALDDYPYFDAVIDNNGMIEDLYQQAIKIVKQFKLT